MVLWGFKSEEENYERVCLESCLMMEKTDDQRRQPKRIKLEEPENKIGKSPALVKIHFKKAIEHIKKNKIMEINEHTNALFISDNAKAEYKSGQIITDFAHDDTDKEYGWKMRISKLYKYPGHGKSIVDSAGGRAKMRMLSFEADLNFIPAYGLEKYIDKCNKEQAEKRTKDIIFHFYQPPTPKKNNSLMVHKTLFEKITQKQQFSSQPSNLNAIIKTSFSKFRIIKISKMECVNSLTKKDETLISYHISHNLCKTFCDICADPTATYCDYVEFFTLTATFEEFERV